MRQDLELLDEQLPYLAHFGLSRDVVESTPWVDLVTYRVWVPHMPPPGYVYAVSPPEE